MVTGMDPQCRAQDVLRCDQCESPSVESHCDTCQSRLCNDCVTRGRCSDSSKPHQVVPYTESRKLRYPLCSLHADKHCQLHCQNCDTAVCPKCISSGTHRGHEFSDVLQKRSYIRKEAGLSQMMDSEIKASEQLGSFSELPIGSKAEKQGFNTSEAQCFIPDKTLLEKPNQEKLVQGKFGKSIQNNSIHCPDKPIGDKSIEEKSTQDKPIHEKPIQDKPIQEKPMQVEQKETKAKLTANKTGSPKVTGYSEEVVRSTRGLQDHVITQYSIRGAQQTRNGYMVYTEETHIVHKLSNLGVSFQKK